VHGLLYKREDGGKGELILEANVIRLDIQACSFVKTDIALIKKKIKFSLYLRKFIMEQLQSHI
jgi:hypothetical protein